MSETFTQADVDRIVRERLKEVTDQRNSLRAELSDAKGTLTKSEKKLTALAAESESYADLKKAHDDLTATHEQAQGRHAMERQLLPQLTEWDEDVADIVARRFKASEAKDFGEWFGKEGKALKVVTPYLRAEPAAPDAPEVTTTQTQTTTMPGATPFPTVNNGAQPTPAPPQPYTPGSINSMSQDEFSAFMKRGYQN